MHEKEGLDIRVVIRIQHGGNGGSTVGRFNGVFIVASYPEHISYNIMNHKELTHH